MKWGCVAMLGIVGCAQAPVNSMKAPSRVVLPTSSVASVAREREGTPPFDRHAAMVTLDDAATRAQGCWPMDEDIRMHLMVEFSPSGDVDLVVPDPDLASPAVTACVVAAFRAAHVPAFAGNATSVGKSLGAPVVKREDPDFVRAIYALDFSSCADEDHVGIHHVSIELDTDGTVLAARLHAPPSSFRTCVDSAVLARAPHAKPSNVPAWIEASVRVPEPTFSQLSPH